MHYFLQYSLKNDSKNMNCSYVTVRFETLAWFSNITKVWFLKMFQTRCNHLTITKLIPNQGYDVYFYAYSLQESKLYRSKKISVETAERKSTLDPVKNLNYTLSLANEAFEANVFWNPGSGQTGRLRLVF